LLRELLLHPLRRHHLRHVLQQGVRIYVGVCDEAVLFRHEAPFPHQTLDD
jgi:hypothetical protein